MPSGMSWLSWCPDVQLIKQRSFNNEYWILKFPGGKKILCLSVLMLRSNQFCKCAMTSLVLTSNLDKFWTCNITPEGEALMLNLYDTALTWYLFDPQYNKLHHHYHVSFHYCHQTPLSLPFETSAKLAVRWANNRSWVVLRVMLLAPNPWVHKGIGNPLVMMRMQIHTVQAVPCKRYASCNTPDG